MGLLRNFASVGAATSASRVLGFVREALIASTLGAGPVADAFYAAFRFPNLFRRLFAEGAFNSAFVPLFAKEVEGNGKQEAANFAGEVFSVLVLILLAITVVALAFMPLLVGTIIAPAFADTPDKFTLTTQLARIMFPYLAAMSLVAMLSGILNSLRRYFLAALAPVLLNVVLIGMLLWAQYSDADARQTGIALAIGVLISGLVQLGVLVYGLHQAKFSFKPKRPRLSPRVKRLLVLAVPAALTGGIVQINLVIGQIIASQQDGAIALLNYADRIYQLPLGIIGIAIGVVLLPELARALKSDDPASANKLQNTSLEFALALTVPAAAALMVIPQEIVTVLYQRGAFVEQTSTDVAAALGAFGIGLPAFVLIKVFQPAYFAREDMRTPMWFSLVSLVVNAAGSVLMFPGLGHVGIAVATSLSAWVNALLLGGTLAVSGRYKPTGSIWIRTAKVVICSALMAGWLVFFAQWTADIFAQGNVWVRIGLLLLTIVIACVVYFGSALASGAMDRQALMRTLKRKRNAA